MKNTDKPAFPVDSQSIDALNMGLEIESGITKLEYFSGLAMQGILSSLSGREPQSFEQWENIATDSVFAAKLLLESIEKDKP